MSRTSLMRAQGVRGSTEQKVTENYAATLAQNLYDKEVTDRTAAITAAVAAEAALRAAADTLLQTNINNEATARGTADSTLQAHIDEEAATREAADNAIANGTRTITPSLGDNTQYGNINLGKKSLQLYGPMYNGANDLQEMAAQIAAALVAISIINGNDTVTGSVDKKVKDAINAFATAITADGTVNTYKEVLDWIATHGADFAALVGQVNTNTGNIAQITAALPSYATAQEIQDAWNPPEPEPSAITIEGDYDAVNSALIVTSTELAKLAAVSAGTSFDLVIHANGVEYSGAAKRVNYIGLSATQEPPGYVTTNNGFPIWDTEWSYDTFNGCVMVSQYDSIDNGEITVGSY